MPWRRSIPGLGGGDMGGMGGMERSVALGSNELDASPVYRTYHSCPATARRCLGPA